MSRAFAALRVTTFLVGFVISGVQRVREIPKACVRARGWHEALRIVGFGDWETSARSKWHKIPDFGSWEEDSAPLINVEL